MGANEIIYSSLSRKKIEEEIIDIQINLFITCILIIMKLVIDKINKFNNQSLPLAKNKIINFRIYSNVNYQSTFSPTLTSAFPREIVKFSIRTVALRSTCNGCDNLSPRPF